MSDLKQRILSEMLIGDRQRELERHLPLAKRYIRFADKEILIIRGDRLGGEDRILLYLVGKMYMAEGGIISEEEAKTASSKELMTKLNICKGSFYTYIKRLREKDLIVQERISRINHYSVSDRTTGRVFKTLVKKTGHCPAGRDTSTF